MATENKEECQHPEQNETRIEFDGDGMYRRMECLKCGDKITEYYDLVNVYNETKGEEEMLTKTTGDEGKQEFFPITSICREDILETFKEDENYEQIKKRIKELTNADMKYLASKMADDYCNQLYWISLRNIFEYRMMEQKEEEEEETGKKRFRQNFKKEVYGFFEVKANSKEEAQEEFDKGDYDEFDNKSDYETEEWEEDEEETLEEHLRHDAFKEASEEND